LPKADIKNDDSIINMNLKGKQLIRFKSYLQKKRKRRIVTIDVKGILERIVPNIFHFVQLEQEYEIIQTKIKKKIEKRISNINDKLIASQNYNFDVYSDADFYDLLYLSTTIGDKHSDQFLANNIIQLLKCFNVLFGELNNRLSEEQKELLRPTFLKILNSQGNQYLDSVGELLVLNFLLYNGLTLEGVAVEFGEIRKNNSKRVDADFLMYNQNYNERYLVEVYNRRITNSKSGCLKRKLRDKMTDTLKDGNVTNHKVCIQSVIWCRSIATILGLAKDVTSQRNFRIQNVWIPLTLFMFPPIDNPHWRFFSLVEAAKY